MLLRECTELQEQALLSLSGPLQSQKLQCTGLRSLSLLQPTLNREEPELQLALWNKIREIVCLL